MNLDLSNLSLSVDGYTSNIPDWFKGLSEFAWSTCIRRDLNSNSQEFFVLSLPEIDGALTAITLGALFAEVDRIENTFELTEIQHDSLEVGMRVGIESGMFGSTRVTGETKSVELDKNPPRVQIGDKIIALKWIKRIYKLPDNVGNPKIFETSRTKTNVNHPVLDKLMSPLVPIHRALIELRTTTTITDDEFTWCFKESHESSGISLKELIKPISALQPGHGLSMVLNSSESEQLAWLKLRSELRESELKADVSLLTSSNAILAQVEDVDSKIVFMVIARDDRQYSATELAIKQKYEYSQPLSRNVDLSVLPFGVELLAFEVYRD